MMNKNYKIENIILTILFVIIVICILLPLIIVSTIVAKICIIVGITSLIGLSYFALKNISKL